MLSSIRLRLLQQVSSVWKNSLQDYHLHLFLVLSQQWVNSIIKISVYFFFCTFLINYIFITSYACIGTPISAAIQQATPNNGYIGIQMFVGAVYVLGAFICLYLKIRLTGSLLAKY